ncbi:carboxy-cis,cis-muconate cyclase [Xylariomycetidae sp. FL0641]|nr:carboxy-cis,cis-muconate cyclase [Xylariomycetidae sp. FL0641]
MRYSTSPLGMATFAGLAGAAMHELIVGTFGTNSLYTLEFDDELLTLELVKNTSTSTSNSWITFNHDKSHLYGTSYNADPPAFVSYTVANATSIRADGAAVAAGGNCTDKAIFVTAAAHPPYGVYGSFFGDDSAGCGGVLSVDAGGALAASLQNYTYFGGSAVHGTAFSPDGAFLYSADDHGNTLWTHAVDPATGALTYVANLTPAAGAHPRHVAVHPTGAHLYVVLEGSSEVAQYVVGADGIPGGVATTYPLKRGNESADAFWADEVALAPSGALLWASNRALDAGARGYVAAFALDGAGAIVKQNFLLPTTSSGGAANSVAPAPFTDRFVAVTDAEAGFVEIWELAADAASAGVVAHLDVVDGGCCANAVWYS